MAAYVIFDVQIHDLAQYQEFMKGVKPAIEAAGGKYLARGGAHKVYEGDWEPRRIGLDPFARTVGLLATARRRGQRRLQRRLARHVGKWQNVLVASC